jgi:hypothetical protein
MLMANELSLHRIGAPFDAATCADEPRTTLRIVSPRADAAF